MARTTITVIAATLVPLILTLPTRNAGMKPLQCEGSKKTFDLREVRVYRQIGSGPFVLHATKDVRGKEGEADTVWVDPGDGASFYATVADTAGNESCPSSTRHIDPGTRISAGATDPVLEVRYYDVHGRRVSDRHARGVYWEARHYLSGRLETKKVVLLH